MSIGTLASMAITVVVMVALCSEVEGGKKKTTTTTTSTTASPTTKSKKPTKKTVATTTTTQAPTSTALPTSTTGRCTPPADFVEFEGAKYLFVTDQALNFADAQDYCLSNYGAFLASITTATAQAFLDKKRCQVADFWLGGISEANEEGFQWLDDSKMTFQNFAVSPAPVDYHDRCISFQHGKFVSGDCALERHFICKYFVPSNTPGVREYFIQSEEVAWNYAPDGRDMYQGHEFNEEQNVFVGNMNDQIGSTYIKCLYRAYTDGSFQTRVPETQESRELGFVGPTIRAVIGETIRVVFRNKCEFPVSMHPHGVSYEKDSEGAGYVDNSDGSSDSAVDGTQEIYLWHAREDAAPADPSLSTSMWMYHGHNDEIGENYAGLNGFLVLTVKGMANPDATPKDVDKEAFSLFMVMNEQLSLYFDKNIETYAPARVGVDQADWEESDLMHNINGYVYGNGPKITFVEGQRVRWYTMGMGTEVDLHTPHWHGNLVTANHMKTDVVSLLPATMVQADMKPDAPGIWLYHCHVNDHIFAGMVTTYEVLPKA